ALNGLVQTLLRVTAPGVPDLYQGTELWDFSLVDPDNRRPVDFDARRALLARGMTCADLLATWRDGAIKQRLIADLLDLRRRRPVLFAEGSYSPLRADGPRGAHVLAFARQHGADAVIVMASRLPLRLQPDFNRPLIEPTLWQGTSIGLPQSLRSTRWRNVLRGEDPRPDAERLAMQDVLATLPVAVLETVP
ncbi:MAG TPA: hypothetical protein VJR58_09335, partial [Vineibacter sp.]|nr:hypothetical protein [Vineibacter sp.]